MNLKKDNPLFFRAVSGLPDDVISKFFNSFRTSELSRVGNLNPEELQAMQAKVSALNQIESQILSVKNQNSNP